MKRLLFCALFALAIVACNHQAAETRNALETTQWYVYNNPINDYDISIFAWMYDTIYYSACEITVFLRKGDMCYSIKQRASYNSFFQDSIDSDTIYIDNPTDNNTEYCLDYRTAVSFADLNFDGKKELIICGSPNFDHTLSNNLNHEDFVVYSIDKDSVIQLHNVMFDRLAYNQDEIEYSVDAKRKVIAIVERFNVLGTTTEVFWFANGTPFLVDYKYEYNYLYGEPVIPDSIVFRFNLPEDEEKYKHVRDSVMLLM